ncbi:MAG TPA: hypothetical protein VH305_09955 [Gaiella sp.]
MTVSVVLRLADAALDAGRLAGEAELVATGERTTVRDADELIRFVTRVAREEAGGSPDVSSGTEREGSG